MIFTDQSDKRERWFLGLRMLGDWKFSEFRDEWAAQWHDRWLWKQVTIFVFCPMIAIVIVLMVLKTTNHLSAHEANVWSTVVGVLADLALILWIGPAARKRRKAAQAEGNS